MDSRPSRRDDELRARLPDDVRVNRIRSWRQGQFGRAVGMGKEYRTYELMQTYLFDWFSSEKNDVSFFCCSNQLYPKLNMVELDEVRLRVPELVSTNSMVKRAYLVRWILHTLNNGEYHIVKKWTAYSIDYCVYMQWTIDSILHAVPFLTMKFIVNIQSVQSWPQPRAKEYQETSSERDSNGVYDDLGKACVGRA